MAKINSGYNQIEFRLRTHRSHPAEHGGGESEGGEVDGLATVISRCHSAPVLQTAEDDFNAVTPLVVPLVGLDGQRAGFAPRNAGFDALLLLRIAEPVSVIAAVGEHPLGLG